MPKSKLRKGKPNPEALKTRLLLASLPPAEPKAMETYQDRSVSLQSLGFDNYWTYLRSGLWKRIRTAGWCRHGKRCRLCPAKATVLHHNSYQLDVLSGDNLDELHPLCEDCHKGLEFDATGAKRTLDAVRWLFYQRRKSYLADSGTTPSSSLPISIPASKKPPAKPKKKRPKYKPPPPRPRCFNCGQPKKRKKKYCRKCSRDLFHRGMLEEIEALRLFLTNY